MRKHAGVFRGVCGLMGVAMVWVCVGCGTVINTRTMVDNIGRTQCEAVPTGRTARRGGGWLVEMKCSRFRDVVRLGPEDVHCPVFVRCAPDVVRVLWVARLPDSRPAVLVVEDDWERMMDVPPGLVLRKDARLGSECRRRMLVVRRTEEDLTHDLSAALLPVATVVDGAVTLAAVPVALVWNGANSCRAGDGR